MGLSNNQSPEWRFSLSSQACPATQARMMTLYRVNSSLPLPINNDVFEGWAIFWAAGLASTPEHMFNGHKRKTSLVVQGKFKQALPFNAVLSGQRFSGPLQHLPASWLTSTILKLVHHINPAMVVGTVSSPSLLAPLVSMAQCINVSQPGTEPSLNASPVEDMRLLGSQFQSPSGTALPANERKHLMTNKEACSQHSFDFLVRQSAASEGTTALASQGVGVALIGSALDFATTNVCYPELTAAAAIL
ncbi:hypothetical protein WJX82_008799 [Trebouxia sp. C0006]